MSTNEFYKLIFELELPLRYTDFIPHIRYELYFDELKGKYKA